MKIEFSNTFKTQIEITPRITIIYKGLFAIEWLWFSVAIYKDDFKG